MYNFDKKEFFLFFLNCRRGMLELDILLLNFLSTRYYDFDIDMKNDFYKLLLESDNNLYIWLIKKTSICFEFSKIINEIIEINAMFEFY